MKILNQNEITQIEYKNQERPYQASLKNSVISSQKPSNEYTLKRRNTQGSTIESLSSSQQQQIQANQPIRSQTPQRTKGTALQSEVYQIKQQNDYARAGAFQKQYSIPMSSQQKDFSQKLEDNAYGQQQKQMSHYGRQHVQQQYSQSLKSSLYMNKNQQEYIQNNDQGNINSPVQYSNKKYSDQISHNVYDNNYSNTKNKHENNDNNDEENEHYNSGKNENNQIKQEEVVDYNKLNIPQTIPLLQYESFYSTLLSKTSSTYTELVQLTQQDFNEDVLDQYKDYDYTRNDYVLGIQNKINKNTNDISKNCNNLNQKNGFSQKINQSGQDKAYQTPQHQQMQKTNEQSNKTDRIVPSFQNNNYEKQDKIIKTLHNCENSISQKEKIINEQLSMFQIKLFKCPNTPNNGQDNSGVNNNGGSKIQQKNNTQLKAVSPKNSYFYQQQQQPNSLQQINNQLNETGSSGSPKQQKSAYQQELKLEVNKNSCSKSNTNTPLIKKKHDITPSPKFGQVHSQLSSPLQSQYKIVKQANDFNMQNFDSHPISKYKLAKLASSNNGLNTYYGNQYQQQYIGFHALVGEKEDKKSSTPSNAANQQQSNTPSNKMANPYSILDSIKRQRKQQRVEQEEREKEDWENTIHEVYDRCSRVQSQHSNIFSNNPNLQNVIPSQFGLTNNKFNFNFAYPRQQTPNKAKGSLAVNNNINCNENLNNYSSLQKNQSHSKKTQTTGVTETNYNNSSKLETITKLTYSRLESLESRTLNQSNNNNNNNQNRNNNNNENNNNNLTTSNNNFNNTSFNQQQYENILENSLTFSNQYQQQQNPKQNPSLYSISMNNSSKYSNDIDKDLQMKIIKQLSSPQQQVSHQNIEQLQSSFEDQKHEEQQNINVSKQVGLMKSFSTVNINKNGNVAANNNSNQNGNHQRNQTNSHFKNIDQSQQEQLRSSQELTQQSKRECQSRRSLSRGKDKKNIKYCQIYL